MENVTVSKDAIMDKTTRERLSLERKIENSRHRYKVPRVKLEKMFSLKMYTFLSRFSYAVQINLFYLLVRDMRCTN